MRYLLSFFIFSVYIYGFNYHLKPYKISDGIHCFFGLPSQVSNVNGGNMVNSCYIETAHAYVVIDSGPTYSYAQEAYKVMQKKKELPVKYVINTSWDEVHVLGNQFYKEVGSELLGPKGYKTHIEEKEGLFLEARLSKDAFINTRVISLDTYIDKEKILNFEKIKIKIKTLKNDINHLYVYIENKSIVFAGDLVFNNRIVPLNHGRSLIEWLEALEELNNLEWSDIISSHGYMTRRSALKNTITYLSLLKSEILKRIKDGESRGEIIENVKLLSFIEDKFYETWHHKNVANVYDELKEIIEIDKVVLKKTTIIKLKPKVIAKKKITVKKEKPKYTNKVRYKSFDKALSLAKRTNKIVLVKVRSRVCKYCDQLDRIFAKNSKVKKILNKYFETVKINTDYESIPMDITVRSTPTLIFIRPDDDKILMKLAGIRALGELLEILNEAVNDGHHGGYLKL